MARAGVSDKELETLSGFPQGVNNVAPDSDLPRDEKGERILALRAAVNTDLVGPSKKPRWRAGTTQKIAGRFHSPATLRAGSTLFTVKNGDLNAYDRSLNLIGTIRAAVGPRYISYAEAGGDLYWSNGLIFRRIRTSDLADLPGWVDCLGVPQATNDVDGGLAAGTYRIALTYFDADRRQSGAVGVCEVDVAAGTGIRVHAFPPVPESAVAMRLYMTPPNGEILYAAADLSTSVTNYALTAANEQEAALETLWCTPLPPLTLLRYWSGRLLGFDGNLLRWSEPLRLGLTTHNNYLRLGQCGTLLEAIGEGSEGAGCWVADHARTYWMAGNKPKDWHRVIKRDHAAVPGTSLVVAGNVLGLETTDQVAFWLSSDGVFCAGLPGGELKPLTEGRLALPGGIEGASMFREFDGLRQIVTSFLAGPPNALAITDSASATVTVRS